MLYLIKSLNYLKVGYTKDKTTYNKRINTYKTHNPEFEVLDVVLDGTNKDESNLHLLLNKYSYYTEWFHDCPEVLKIWNTYTKGMKRYNSLEEELNSIKESLKEFVTNNRMEMILKDVDKIFTKRYVMTGEEIKNTLKEIYSYYGLKSAYVEIKTLNKFGYSLVRFLDENEFKYKITKI